MKATATELKETLKAHEEGMSPSTYRAFLKVIAWLLDKHAALTVAESIAAQRKAKGVPQ